MLVALVRRSTSLCAGAAMLVCPAMSKRMKRRGLPGTSRTKSCAAVAFTTRKLAGGRSMFVAPALISHFAAVWMPRRKDEPLVLSDAAQRVLKVLRREHELATGDLRAESGVTERAAFTRALDELQRQMKVIPQDVIYQPFSYIWIPAEDRFPEELRKRGAVSGASGVAARRKTALREIARAYLAGAGMSVLGETARASGLSRVEAGSGNHQLVDEGYAIRLRQGIYALASSKNG